jgi:hypothetical protein
VNEAVETVVVRETDDMPLRGRCAHAHLPCQDRQGVEETSGTPARVPGAFVVDLLEDTGMMDRVEAELLMSWIKWVEVEARGFPDLVEGLCRLRWAVIKAAAVGRAP